MQHVSAYVAFIRCTIIKYFEDVALHFLKAFDNCMPDDGDVGRNMLY
jgi:hypothetical protein